MKRFFNLMVVIVTAACLGGCAVGMALHGKREPQINDLRKGMEMEEVHFIMRDYTPKVTYKEDGTRIEEYTVQLGNAPSGGKALGHLAMDVLTFGTWEVVGTPMEAFSSGKMILVIEYGEDEKVSKIKAGKSEEGL